MYTFFERLIQPFPNPSKQTPPKTMLLFCWHYALGAKRYFLLMAVLTATVAIMEVSLFAFLGQLVDWLNLHTPETLMETSRFKLIGLAILILLVMPVTILFRSLVIHQTLLGNFPMTIRWLSHRYLLGQSLSLIHI